MCSVIASKTASVGKQDRTTACETLRPTAHGRVLRAVDDRTRRGTSDGCRDHQVWLTSAERRTYRRRDSSTRACLDQALRTTKHLQLDEARCFCSHEVTVFLEHDGVELDVASGGDH